MKWNGTLGQKYRHINTDYVYATVLVDDYAIWSNNYQSNMFEGTSDAVLPVGPSSLAVNKYFKYKLCSNRTTTNARHLGV